MDDYSLIVYHNQCQLIGLFEVAAFNGHSMEWDGDLGEKVEI